MIQTNARDDRDILLDDVGRIEPAPEADFENRELHAIAKVKERHRRHHFEIRGRVE